MEVFTGSHSLIGTLLLMVLIGMRKFPGAGGCCTGADVNPGTRMVVVVYQDVVVVTMSMAM